MRRSRGERLVAYIPVLAAMVAYGLTASSHLQGGDNAEFVTLYSAPGVAHPSGYPLYTLLLRLASVVTGVSGPLGASLATAAIGVVAVLLFALAARRWGATSTAAGPCASLFAFSPLFWHLSTHAEVFALHAAIGAGILAVAAPSSSGATSDAPRAFLLGLLAGLGLTNNLTLVALAPLGLTAAFLLVRASERPVRAVLLGGAGLVAGLLPYLALPLLAQAPGAAWVWGDVTSPAGLLHHVLRKDFGTFQLGIYSSEGHALRQQLEFVMHLLRDTHGIGLVAGLAGGLALLLGGALPQRSRAPGWALVASFVLAGPVLLARMNLAPDGVAERIIERFYLLPQMLLLFMAAFAFSWLERRFLQRSVLSGSLVSAAICLLAMIGMDRLQRERSGAVDDYLRNTLQMLPPNAVLLGTGDHRLFGFLYLREIEAVRPDVVYVDSALLLYPWYAARIERQLGFSLQGIDHAGASVAMPAVIASTLNASRPTYLTNVVSQTIPASFRIVPIGTVFEVLPPDAPMPSLDELARRNRAVSVLFRIDPTPPLDGDSWAALVFDDYARPWRELARAYRAAGHADVADVMDGYVLKLIPAERVSR